LDLRSPCRQHALILGIPLEPIRLPTTNSAYSVFRESTFSGHRFLVFFPTLESMSMLASGQLDIVSRTIEYGSIASEKRIPNLTIILVAHI
jgi:hypothetical protein